LTISEDEVDEFLILLCSPRTLLQPHFVTARLPSHFVFTTTQNANKVYLESGIDPSKLELQMNIDI